MSINAEPKLVTIACLLDRPNEARHAVIAAAVRMGMELMARHPEYAQAVIAEYRPHNAADAMLMPSLADQLTKMLPFASVEVPA
ncbi:MAG: hypothetical protein KGK07_12890 [Chloroflexota bacterium]|nr:hypothetical protein [Chloroflexota bacterium]